MKTNCTKCGKEISKSPSQIKRSKTGNLYCSKSCAVSNNNSLFKQGRNHPNYKSGISFYRSLKLSNISKPKCERCGIEHPCLLQVHHIDENRKNNDLSNLIILCANCHLLAHCKIPES